MKKKKTDWIVWLFVILYFGVIGGIIYLFKVVIASPIIGLIIIPTFCYLAYKERIPGITLKDSVGAIELTSFIIAISVFTIFAKTYVYESYLAEFVVDGHMVTKTVTVEADEGPGSWEEQRTYWQPNTLKGERVIKIIDWLLIALCVGTIIVCVKCYILAKEKSGDKC